MYHLTEKDMFCEGKSYRAYGIKYDDEYFVEDISTDKAKVLSLIQICEKHCLSPLHLKDAAEDFILI